MSIAENFEIIADAVYDKGKQDEWSDFWNIKQQFGTLRDYVYAFAGGGWTDKNFKPKYTIVTAKSTNKTNFLFAYSLVTKIMTPLYLYDSSNNSTFLGCVNLTKIGDDTGGGLWVTKNRVFNSNFLDCSKLEEIRFLDYNEKGEYVPSEIGNNISFSGCSLLSADSQVNIIKHLVDFSGTSDEGKRILSIHPTAFERLNVTYSTPEEVGIPFFGSWVSYIESIGWHM
jgi:hypothetical protein